MQAAIHFGVDNMRDVHVVIVLGLFMGLLIAETTVKAGPEQVCTLDVTHAPFILLNRFI